jgi:Acetyltransferase (GNAT) family
MERREVGGALGFRESPTNAILRVLALVPEARGDGLGRELLGVFEETAARAGVTSIALGAGQAAGFYVRCGWTPLLLLQWVRDLNSFEAEAEAVLAGPGLDRSYQRGSYMGVPQLFVETGIGRPRRRRAVARACTRSRRRVRHDKVGLRATIGEDWPQTGVLA